VVDDEDLLDLLHDAHGFGGHGLRLSFAARFRTGAAMAVAADTYTQKTDEQKAITEMVRQFADNEIIPVAEEYDHEDKFPEPIVEQMKELGLFGVTIPEEYGGMGLDLTTYAMIVEELSRGWISISGVVNTHFIGSYLLMKFGTEEQKDHFLPKMATGEIRAAFSLSEPEVGSDVQGIKSTAKKADGGNWELNGQKMWVTNGLLSGLVFVLAKNDPKADPPYKGMTCFICEKEPGVDKVPGLTIPPKIKKMGYKGVESTELVFDGFEVSEDRILGGPDGVGQGFVQMMDALEVGRVNVAARGVGVAQRALELALRYSQERKAFGKPIAQHQAISFKLAEMGTRVEAARLLTMKAARLKDAGERSDLEAGMAKLFASESAKENAEECLRIHGGYGYSKEYEIERIYRDAPLLLIGEGTSEIQKMVIGRKLLERNKI
jgi:alkylation response protein AidB-like acyl-CoA dehydrogenase